MRTVEQLDRDELILYSKVLIRLTELLLNDKNFSVNFMEGFEGKRFVRFPCDWAGIMQFDRETREFSYSDISIPVGIFDDIIEYGI